MAELHEPRAWKDDKPEVEGTRTNKVEGTRTPLWVLCLGQKQKQERDIGVFPTEFIQSMRMGTNVALTRYRFRETGKEWETSSHERETIELHHLWVHTANEAWLHWQ